MVIFLIAYLLKNTKLFINYNTWKLLLIKNNVCFEHNVRGFISDAQNESNIELLAFICLFIKWIKLYAYFFAKISYVIKSTKYCYFMPPQKQHIMIYYLLKKIKQ